MGRTSLIAPMPRLWAALLLTSCLAAWPSICRAKALPLSVAGQVGYVSPKTLLVVGELQWPVNDVFALRARVGPQAFGGPVDVVALVGPVARWDVLTWVPSVVLLGGIEAIHVQPVVHGGLELARHISLHTAIVGSIGATYRFGKNFGALATLGASHTF